MLYCENCRILTPGPCHRCGRKVKKLREPLPSDAIFIISCRFQYASIIEPLLSDSCIPCYRDGALGAALSTTFGSLLELYNFYVPYVFYPDAYDLLTGIFAEDEEVMQRIESYGMTADEIAALKPAEFRIETAEADTYAVDKALYNNFAAEDISFAGWLIDRMQLEEGMSVADICCGAMSPWSGAPLPGNMLVTLCAGSEKTLRQIEREIQDTASAAFDYNVASMGDLPFTDGVLDRVLATDTQFSEAHISEICRVLRPEGWLCAIIIPDDSMGELIDLCRRHGIALRPGTPGSAESLGLIHQHFNTVNKSSHAIRYEITEATPLMNYIRLLSGEGKNTGSMKAVENEIVSAIERDGKFTFTKTVDAYTCSR